jgi:hypothetical protein
MPDHEKRGDFAQRHPRFNIREKEGVSRIPLFHLDLQERGEIIKKAEDNESGMVYQGRGSCGWKVWPREPTFYHMEPHFSCHLEKFAVKWPQQPVELAFFHIFWRFLRALSSCNPDANIPPQGVVPQGLSRIVERNDLCRIFRDVSPWTA